MIECNNGKLPQMRNPKFKIVGLTIATGLILGGCSQVFDNPGPNEFLVQESRSLAIPPDYDLRPPSAAAKNDTGVNDDLPGTETAPSDLEVASRSVEGATTEDPDAQAREIKEASKGKPKNGAGSQGFSWLVNKIF